MTSINQVFQSILELMQLGGPVLWVLLGLCLFMWLLIMERYRFVLGDYPQQSDKFIEEWKHYRDAVAWKRENIREYLLAEAKGLLNKNIALIKLCISLCPMFGLLGTVVGMISVFDTIGVFGTSDSRALSSGISMATIPTVVGITVALSGYYFHLKLLAMIKRRTILLADRMMDHA